MNSGCCLNCQAQATKKKIKEKSDEDDMKQEQKVSENENPKTDSNDKKKNKNIVTWQHSSTKKEKSPSKNLLSEKKDVSPPCSTASSMMCHGGPNPSSRWPISAFPRAPYPAFPMAPMYGPYGGSCPIQPYHSMPRATMFNGPHISPYPPMGAAAPFPYRRARPYMDSNPMERYTNYADNYSYFFF
ncbi:hypothetical protein V5N11_030171 [Cardamine amara subsp. amara]|uniref:Uncharacterized protein n=1 Tax=Cardamine amara subsp. amara TaxID=228776 RepID=A0ABD1BCM6_CARAN